MRILRTSAIIACLTACGLDVFAGVASVGRRGTVQFTWDGDPLRTVDQNVESPFHCEITSTDANGDATVYTLSYTLLEPGRHNLNTALLDLYGRPVTGLPDVIVSTETLLPESYKGELLPHRLAQMVTLSGYTPRMLLLLAAWCVAGGLFLVKIWPRKEKVVDIAPERGPSVAELLRPLILKASENALTTEEKVRLTRILIRFWQVSLGLSEAEPTACIEHLRSHPQAGTLMGHLDRWLYSPDPVSYTDLAGILQPYSSTLAADLHLEDLK